MTEIKAKIINYFIESGSLVNTTHCHHKCLYCTGLRCSSCIDLDKFTLDKRSNHYEIAKYEAEEIVKLIKDK